MKTNVSLHKAKAQKNDEFYTQLTDIEKELKHYKIISVEKLFIAIAMIQKNLISGSSFH